VTANLNISKSLPSEYLQMKLFLELQLKSVHLNMLRFFRTAEDEGR